jgi:uncharacterized membrane protein YeaQ/YmgE (transglycosylase-associated protein family)
MSLINLIVFIVIGIVAGWLAGLIWKGRGFGTIGNLVVGVAGPSSAGSCSGSSGSITAASSPRSSPR